MFPARTILYTFTNASATRPATTTPTHSQAWALFHHYSNVCSMSWTVSWQFCPKVAIYETRAVECNLHVRHNTFISNYCTLLIYTRNY
jgi:hypothetical protein